MSDYSHLTLKEYLKEVFHGKLFPELKRPGDFLRAINKFNEWFGDDAAIADVSEKLLEDFENAKGAKPSRVTHVRDLWRLMRTAAPDRFRGKRAKSARQEIAAVEGPSYLLAKFYDQLYEPMALRTRRPNTKRLYVTTIQKFSECLGREANLDDFTDEQVTAFAAWRREKGLSKNSINKDLFNLLAIWRWANRRGYVETWPNIEMEKPAKVTPEAWSREELARLFKAASEVSGRLSGVPASAWWTTLLLVLWDTGERINAVVSLKWDRIDFDGRWVRFDAEYRKGGRSDNLRKLSPQTTEALGSLKRWQESAETYSSIGKVFVWPHGATHIYYQFGKVLEAAGLPNDGRSKFHRLRRSVASHYEAAGGNATELLGHTKREVTKAYLDPRIVGRVEAIDLLFRPNEKGGAK